MPTTSTQNTLVPAVFSHFDTPSLAAEESTAGTGSPKGSNADWLIVLTIRNARRMSRWQGRKQG
ncbi:hypothetical protein ACVWY2_009091 [Bradyrhizobium sp. JR6.1]